MKSGVPENADSTDVRLRATTRQKQGWMWMLDGRTAEDIVQALGEGVGHGLEEAGAEVELK